MCHGARRLEGRKSVAWAGLLGWGSFRWLLGSKRARRVKVADGCWCLGVGGGRCVAGCCRPGNVRLLVRNEVRAEDLGKKWTIWGNYASRSGTVGAVGARLDRDWMAIGIILNLSNCPLVSMSLSQSVRVEFWSYNESREVFGMKSEQRVWGKSGQFEATMRVGVVLLGRLERDWIAIGWRLESSSTWATVHS